MLCSRRYVQSIEVLLIIFLSVIGLVLGDDLVAYRVEQKARFTGHNVFAQSQEIMLVNLRIMLWIILLFWNSL